MPDDDNPSYQPDPRNLAQRSREAIAASRLARARSREILERSRAILTYRPRRWTD